MSDTPSIVVVRDRIEETLLRDLVALFFEDMVKYVVDIEREVAAVGGELVLLEGGSRQEDLWGANYYPGRGAEECIEYTSLINIRPAQNNRSMVIEDEVVKGKVRDLTIASWGAGSRSREPALRADTREVGPLRRGSSGAHDRKRDAASHAADVSSGPGVPGPLLRTRAAARRPHGSGPPAAVAPSGAPALERPRCRALHLPDAPGGAAP